jgi:hypothetical protein
MGQGNACPLLKIRHEKNTYYRISFLRHATIGAARYRHRRYIDRPLLHNVARTCAGHEQGRGQKSPQGIRQKTPPSGAVDSQDYFFTTKIILQ